MVGGWIAIYIHGMHGVGFSCSMILKGDDVRYIESEV